MQQTSLRARYPAPEQPQDLFEVVDVVSSDHVFAVRNVVEVSGGDDHSFWVVRFDC